MIHHPPPTVWVDFPAVQSSNPEVRIPALVFSGPEYGLYRRHMPDGT